MAVGETLQKGQKKEQDQRKGAKKLIKRVGKLAATQE